MQGYLNTTVQKIADLASVNLGLLSYYFKTKNNIIKIIYTEFLDSIDEIIGEVCCKDDDIMIYYMVKERIYYDIIFKDSNNLRFFKEVINSSIIIKLMEEHTIDNFKIINDTNNFNIDLNFIKCYSALEIGGRYNILKKYFNKSFNIEYDDLVDILVGCTPRLFGKDNDAQSIYLDKSRELKNQIDFSIVKFLI